MVDGLLIFEPGSLNLYLELILEESMIVHYIKFYEKIIKFVSLTWKIDVNSPESLKILHFLIYNLLGVWNVRKEFI